MSKSYVSLTGSSLGTYRRNGEVMAVCHKTGVAPIKTPAPTCGQSQTKDSFKDPGQKAALMPYHPNALRNRLPVEFKNAAVPQARFCYPRNEHTYDFLSGSTEPGYKPFRTTSQNFYGYDQSMLAVGESNQGIVSEKAKWLHSKQIS